MRQTLPPGLRAGLVVSAALLCAPAFAQGGQNDPLKGTIEVPIKPMPAPQPGQNVVHTSILFGQGTGEWGAASAPSAAGSGALAPAVVAPGASAAPPAQGASPAGVPLIGGTASASAPGTSAAGLVPPPAKVYQTMAQAAQAGVDPFKKSQPALGASGAGAPAEAVPPVVAVAPVAPAAGAENGPLIARVMHYFNDSTHIALFLGGAIAIAWLLSMRRKRVVA